ncbi:cytidylyltransferase domain-containing protein [Winogradskyella ouciana]|uniref:Spore coat polysaccharide biosynthesis protein SpsF n=1 Tax=Winogradskyella ouciana TaxID=2608631 RepID=A0A7K1GFN4_9FLAO|nr:hypothetical protein [Winogradskyella ouciana]MTE27208.1 hypothetical protein [Winogradskyella ouciana]
MEGGQFKITAIIQARLGSTRLPNKVLLPLPATSNNSILKIITSALKQVDLIDEIFVATSKVKNNDGIESECDKLSLNCYRGSEEDVLSRFSEIVSANNSDYVLRFTADNPVIDTGLLLKFINNHLTKGLDYSKSEGLPLGCNFEMIKSTSLISADKNTKVAYHREHVTPYIIENTTNQEIFKFKTLDPINNIRFTIDYPSDYAFMNLIYSYLDNNISHCLKDFSNIIEKNSWLSKINSNNYQKIKAETFNEEIDAILPIIKLLELNKLSDFLKDEKQKKYNL